MLQDALLIVPPFRGTIKSGGCREDFALVSVGLRESCANRFASAVNDIDDRSLCLRLQKVVYGVGAIVS